MKTEAGLKNIKKIPANNNVYCEKNADLEDIERRDLFSKNYNCHNRARKTVLFGSPIHYLNTATNKYEDIDLSLKTSEDSFVNDANGFKTVFNKDTKSDFVFEITKDDYTLSLKLVNQNSAKGEEKAYSKQVNDESKFVVKDNKDVEYSYKVLNNKVKDEIVISKKQDDYRYDFIIEVKNLEVQLADDGNINLVDSETKQIKFYIPKPFMVDNSGEQSKDIDCLVSKNSESSYLLSLIPNTIWLNDKERSFPVVIDPEIAEYYDLPFTVKTYHRTYIYNSSGSDCYWELVSNEISYLDSDYRIEIFLDISSLSIPLKNITSLIFNFRFLGQGNMFINNVYFDRQSDILDIGQLVTSSFDGHLVIEFESGTYLIPLYFQDIYYGIDFEIEYILDSFGDTKKAISLSSSINALVDLADGDLMATIPDTLVEAGNFSIPIYHNYRRYDNNQNCGKYFMLNLHQKIKQIGDNFFYLNQNGEYEVISEKYYYIGNDWCRHYVQKSQLILTDEQELAVTINGVTYNVYRELITDSGLSFSSRVEQVNCLEYIDQRIDSEKEIQDYLDSCITSFKSLKLFNYSTKNKINFNVVANYISDNFASFLSQAVQTVLVMDESAILQYLSISLQKDLLNKQKQELQNKKQELINDDGDQDEIDELTEQITDIDSQISIASNQLTLILNNSRNQKSQIEKLYSNYLTKRQEYKDLRRLIPQWILDGGSIKYGFNYLGDLCVMFNDYNDYFSIVWKKINTQNGQVEVIDKLVNDDVSALFEYSYSGELSTINNCGKMVHYNYSGNKLEGIFYPNGEFVRFSYKTNGSLSSIATSSQKIYDFSYDNLTRVNLIKSSSFISTLDSSSGHVLKETNYYSNLSKYQTSNITFSYQTGKTIISTNNISSYYYYDDNRNVYMSYSYSLETGIYDDLKLSYYEKNFCLVTISPKKPYLKFDNNSSVPDELESILIDMDIYYEDLPNISSLTGGQYPNYGEADYAISYLDCFNRATEEKTNWQKISANKYVKTITNYFYGAQYYLNPCIKKTITHYESSNPLNSQTIIEKYKEIEEYEYDGNNRLERTKRYVLGEELTNGVDIVEYEYDEKGNQTIKRFYNSLDSSSKFYEENEYRDDGLLTKSFGDTKESCTEYSYDNLNRLISETTSNGIKIAYGYDQLDRLNSISQSTEIGEQNKVDRKYLFDSMIYLSDRNNLVSFEYDKKRRVKTINHNGVVTSFMYSGSSYDDTAYVCPSNVSINGVQFYGYRADKIVTTSYGNSLESYYDKKGRLFEIKEGNNDKYRANYDSDLLQKEFIRKNSSNSTGYFINYTYDSYRQPIVAETIDNGVCSLTENYGYDDYRKITGKTLNYYGGEYDYYYSYSEDSRHILTAISIFGDYVIHPCIDENSRYIGKEISDNSNNLLLKEKIVYRQIGDHSTNMPSSVYYDSFTNGVKTSTTKIKYKYDASNNITEIREDDLLINKYHYDSLNRLIREDNRKLNKSFFFTYDNNGNLLAKKETDYTLAKKDEISSFDNVLNCLYDGDKLISFDGEPIIYDQYNRPTNYRGVTMSWDRNKLTQFGSVSFAYDGLGRRISKGSISYLYDTNGQLIGQNNQGDTLIFAYDYSGIVGFKYDGVEYIYKKNIQGDVIGIIRVDSNQLVASYIYDAWGNHVVLDTNGNEVANHSHIGFINPFRYRSYYYDDETGFYYLKSRYYDPQTCRFISLDSLDYLNPERVNGLNLWIYCYDNPIMLEDSNGNNPQWWQWLISGVALVVGAALCFVPGGQAFGVSLLVAGSLTMVSNILSATGVSGKIVSLVTSGLNIVAGIALCFTPFASIGASMIGAGIGGIAGGFISEALGGSFEIGSFIGSFIGGIVGGKIYDYFKFSKIASQGIAISKGDRYIIYAKEHNLAHYKGFPGYDFISNISKPIADRLGWANNYHFINSVMKHGGFIYNLGGSLTNSYAKEIELIGNYLFLFNIL